jgi:hypothetical protein
MRQTNNNQTKQLREEFSWKSARLTELRDLGMSERKDLDKDLIREDIEKLDKELMELAKKINN